MEVKLYVGQQNLEPSTLRLDWQAIPVTGGQISFIMNGTTYSFRFGTTESDMVHNDQATLNLFIAAFFQYVNDLQVELGIYDFTLNEYVVDETTFTTFTSPFTFYNLVIFAGPTEPEQVYVIDTLVDNTESYTELDLFKDESIQFTSKLADIEKLSNIFTDFSDSFTIPATPNNSAALKYYFDYSADDDYQFNANIRVNAYIEIDTYVFRNGKFQLEGVQMKDGEPYAYKITFFGGLKQLTDLIGDDTIDKLDYNKNQFGVTDLEPTWTKLSQFDYQATAANLLGTISNPSFMDGNIITPLIAYADRDWNYGTNNTIDIATSAGAILDTELRQAIRLMRIIEAIENKYSITFTRDFFGLEVMNNAYMWMNERESILDNIKSFLISPPDGTDDGAEGSHIDFTNGIITLKAYKYKQVISGLGTCDYKTSVYYNIVPSDNTITYTSKLYKNGNVLFTFENVTGTNNMQSLVSSLDYPGYNRPDIREDVYYLEIIPSRSMTFDTSVATSVKRWASIGTQLTLVQIDSYHTITPLITYTNIERDLPKLKVIDFIQGLMKQFKLIIRPVSDSLFYLDTINSYYDNGNILNINQYVDEKTIQIDRPLIYKSIDFKYQKTENVNGKAFRENNNPSNLIGYGDLNSKVAIIESKEVLTVELPFENMLFERMVVVEPNILAGLTTNITIGQSCKADGNTISKNKSKPIIFFNNGLMSHPDTPIYLKFSTLTAEPFIYSYQVGNTNDAILDQVTNTLNYGEEIDPWHLVKVDKSLFKNYWKDWIDTIYSLKQRKFTYNVQLPPRYVQELSLNDRVIINNNRFKINDYKIDLATGKGVLTLFNDIYDWNHSQINELGKTFGAFDYYDEDDIHQEWVLRDYYVDTAQSYITLYGNFTLYNGDTNNAIIRLNFDGTPYQYTSFGDGFTLSDGLTMAPQRLGASILQHIDGRMIVTGIFEKYDGVSTNNIAYIDINGLTHSGFNPGVGFDGATTTIAPYGTSESFLIGGSFFDYKGLTAYQTDYFVKVDAANGNNISINTGGVGFNNAITSMVASKENPNKIYVVGAFTTHNGNSRTHIIAIDATGFGEVTSFVPQVLTSESSAYLKVIQSETNSIYVGGDISSYDGETAWGIVKILPSGQIDTSFDSRNGFDGLVTDIRLIHTDKVLVTSNSTTYAGTLIQNGNIILNANGTIFRELPAGYDNIFVIGTEVYGNLAFGPSIMIADLSIAFATVGPIQEYSIELLSTNEIIMNAGSKYFDINVLKDAVWSVEAMDMGFGTEWIELSYPKQDTLTILVKEKASQTPPEVLLSRRLILNFTVNGILTQVLVVQNGLID